VTHHQRIDDAGDSIIDHLRAVHGQAFVNRLMNAVGGSELNPPRPSALHDGHFLVQRLGWDDAKALCDETTERFYVPSGGPHDIREWDSYFLRAYFQRKTSSQMAAEKKVSMRHVRRAAAIRGWGAEFRCIVAQAASGHIWRYRNRIIGEVVSGECSRAEASQELGCEENTVTCWTLIYRHFGCIAQHISADNSSECPPAVSNGGLTRLPSHDSIQEADDAERAPAVTYG